MSKKVLVTGGTGFIGAALVKKLLEKGYHVRSLDNDSRGSVSKLGKFAKDVELVKGDIRESEAVLKAGKGIDEMIHLAYINGTEFFYSKPEMVLDVAVRGMINVLDSCKANQIRNLVLASSSEVYQTPPTIPTDESAPLVVPDVMNPRYSYGGGKIICELMAINYGRKNFDRVAIFRPHNVYGSDMGFEHVIPQFISRTKKLIKENPKGVIPFEVQGDGQQTRAFVYIDDFTDGLMRVVEKGGHLEIYHIGTNDEISMGSLAEKVVKFFGRELKLISGPEMSGATLRRMPNISKLKALGYSPKVSLDEGLSKTIPWYIENSRS
ncbi:MAG: nucleoside-diphosphate-sugar epimerase [Bacteriovoracaceae bacterium]|nr:nucleoside-diphosphate-sugar epimerase [Bacteriovoracaceae bacterium]